MKNHKYINFSLSTSSTIREFNERHDQKKFMLIKDKSSKRLLFLKNGVYVKDTKVPRVLYLRKAENDCSGLKNILYSKVYPLFPCVFLLVLSGCMGVYEGGFECPAGTGVGCKSISEVNDLVNAGELPQKTPSPLSVLESKTQESKAQESETQKLEIWYSPSFIREHVRYKRGHDKVPS